MSGEPERWRQRGHWIGALLALCLSAYVAGYFALGWHPRWLGTECKDVRAFRFRMIRNAYYPLAWIDAHLNQHVVILQSTEDEDGEWILISPPAS